MDKAQIRKIVKEELQREEASGWSKEKKLIGKKVKVIHNGEFKGQIGKIVQHNHDTNRVLVLFESKEVFFLDSLELVD